MTLVSFTGAPKFLTLTDSLIDIYLSVFTVTQITSDCIVIHFDL